MRIYLEQEQLYPQNCYLGQDHHQMQKSPYPIKMLGWCINNFFPQQEKDGLNMGSIK